MTEICLYGDSILGRLTKPRLAALESALPAGTMVANCAVGGWDSVDGARGADFVARLRADIVVLSFGMNDCAPLKHVALDDFERNVASMIQAFSPSTVLALLPPSIAERGGSSVRGRDNATLRSYRESLRDAVSPLLAVDADAALIGSIGDDVDVHDGDGIHLNDAGYVPVIAALAQHITTILTA